MAKVLVVDDDLELQDLFKFTFESAGYEVCQAFNGKEGLERIEKDNPDIVILDVVMPEMNGFEVMQEIRNRPEICLTPVIMLTTLSKAKDKLTGIKLGADDYLVKPLEPYELIARVEGLLKRYNDTLVSSSVTHLPGRTKLEAEIKAFLEQKKLFSIIYLDINNFKEYNTKYGYNSGDKVLKLVAGMLRSTITAYGNNNDFISHLGADNFVIITTQDKAEDVAKELISLFDDLLSRSYDEETLKNGFFMLDTPDGEKQKVGIMKLVVGVANINPTQFSHQTQVMDYVKEVWLAAKEQAQKTNQNALAVA